jgi:hypothetical protein
MIRDSCCRTSILLFTMTIGVLATSRAKAVTLPFAGRTWTVKESNSPVGPGPNRFSSSPSDVWSDAQGLHLTIHKTGANWYSTEVILNETHGYGTYFFQTTSRQDILNSNATFGAFTWDPNGGDSIPNNPWREIDFEDGRWGNAADPTNSQVVVQPYFVDGNLQRLTLPDLSANADLTRYFTWSQSRIDFYTLRGHYTPFNFPAASVIHHYTYIANGTTHLVPTPGQENFRFNLWLFESSAPAGNQPVEVVVNTFGYLPLLSGDYNSNGAVDAADYVMWRKTFGQTGFGLAADGNGNNSIDAGDYGVWRAHVGQSVGGGASMSVNVPEPLSWMLTILAAAGGSFLCPSRMRFGGKKR